MGLPSFPHESNICIHSPGDHWLLMHSLPVSSLLLCLNPQLCIISFQWQLTTLIRKQDVTLEFYIKQCVSPMPRSSCFPYIGIWNGSLTNIILEKMTPLSPQVFVVLTMLQMLWHFFPYCGLLASNTRQRKSRLAGNLLFFYFSFLYSVGINYTMQVKRIC